MLDRLLNHHTLHKTCLHLQYERGKSFKYSEHII